MESKQAEQAKTYYVLPLDSYGQPNGDIIEIEATEAELDTKYKPFYSHIYTDYIAALYRAMD